MKKALKITICVLLVLVLIVVFVFSNRTLFFDHLHERGIRFVFPEKFTPGEDATLIVQILVSNNKYGYEDLKDKKIYFFATDNPYDFYRYDNLTKDEHLIWESEDLRIDPRVEKIDSPKRRMIGYSIEVPLPTELFVGECGKMFFYLSQFFDFELDYVVEDGKVSINANSEDFMYIPKKYWRK